MPRRSKRSSRSSRSAKRSSRKKRTARRVFRASSSSGKRVRVATTSHFSLLPPDLKILIGSKTDLKSSGSLANTDTAFHQLQLTQRHPIRDPCGTYKTLQNIIDEEFTNQRPEINLRNCLKLSDIGKFVDELPTLLKQATALRALTVGSQYFSSENALKLANALHHKKELTGLNLTPIRFDDTDKEGLTALANYIEESNVTQFTYRDANIGATISGKIPLDQVWWKVETLANAFTQLLSLDLGYNALQSTGCQMLVSNLNPQIKALSLVHNYIDCTAGDALAQFIKKSTVLGILNLSHNNLGRKYDERDSAIISQAGSDSLVKKEDIVFDDSGVEAIMNALDEAEKNPKFVLDLDLSNNNISDGMTEIINARE